MGQSKAKKVIGQLLEEAGITINGSHDYDIQVKDERLYQRVLKSGSIGLGESYMDGWWDCRALDQFFYLLLWAGIDHKAATNASLVKEAVQARLLNWQSPGRAKKSIGYSYDLGNDLFKAMLDKRLVYSCGYWKNSQNLEDAQTAKLDLICRKIGLKPGMKVLDIGSGWGSFAYFAAKEYEAEVLGVVLSNEQYEYSREICKGLPVDIRYQDYRELSGQFDRIVSIGMFEHVGHKNYPEFMKVAERCLTDEGIFLLHTIGGNFSVSSLDAWLDKYIFPDAMLPSARQITYAAEGLFVMEDWHNFGTDYDKTLMAWYHNFVNNWPQLKEKYDTLFYRMWTYYLLSCAGSFRARKNQLWQIVFSKQGIPGGYESIR